MVDYKADHDLKSSGCTLICSLFQAIENCYYSISKDVNSIQKLLEVSFNRTRGSIRTREPLTI